jgi:uncharacterized protein
MQEDDFELIYSPLCQQVTHKGEEYNIEIYQDENGKWMLEVVAPDNSSIVWGDRFDEDKAALAEALQAIHEETLDDAEEVKFPEELQSASLANELSYEELMRLDEILQGRFSEEDEDNPELDEGIFNISELDGFLTAIVSGLNTIMPSQWLASIWGDVEPVWEKESDLLEFMELSMRLMNTISGSLINDPMNFEPLFQELEKDGETIPVVDSWCYGYLRAMEIDKSNWSSTDPDLLASIQLIQKFGDDETFLSFTDHSYEEVLEQIDAIPDAAILIHSHFLHQRSDNTKSTFQQPIQRDTPKVGRNDPCPCGSGKKFKKCCLH